MASTIVAATFTSIISETITLNGEPINSTNQLDIETVNEFADTYNLKLLTFKRDANNRLYFVYQKPDA